MGVPERPRADAGPALLLEQVGRERGRPGIAAMLRPGRALDAGCVVRRDEEFSRSVRRHLCNLLPEPGNLPFVSFVVLLHAPVAYPSEIVDLGLNDGLRRLRHLRPERASEHRQR
ncbi:hypothetical protein CPLU01_08813 [Colletotrichum plurivorum]|uniref:Uncharacterized protein n=1 Tax=Colletotrichum plurivorum TaxID=2175906 RepID=A0A8H6KAM6_9PEZI|nr:hypothetical protein CPLU01_08813 [Colletotrichum plurivorum]